MSDLEQIAFIIFNFSKESSLGDNRGSTKKQKITFEAWHASFT